MPYLLDSDFLIKALAGYAGTLQMMERLAPSGMAVSIVSTGELYEVAFRSPNPEAFLGSLRRFLLPFPIVHLAEPIMERFAEIRCFLRRRGELIPDFDILIGATALYHGLTLLTYDTGHMKRIPDLRIAAQDAD